MLTVNRDGCLLLLAATVPQKARPLDVEEERLLDTGVLVPFCSWSQPVDGTRTLCPVIPKRMRKIVLKVRIIAWNGPQIYGTLSGRSRKDQCNDRRNNNAGSCANQGRDSQPSDTHYFERRLEWLLLRSYHARLLSLAVSSKYD